MILQPWLLPSSLVHFTSEPKRSAVKIIIYNSLWRLKVLIIKIMPLESCVFFRHNCHFDSPLPRSQSWQDCQNCSTAYGCWSQKGVFKSHSTNGCSHTYSFSLIWIFSYLCSLYLMKSRWIALLSNSVSFVIKNILLFFSLDDYLSITSVLFK